MGIALMMSMIGHGAIAADDFGTAEEARTMIEAAALAVAADDTAAMEAFTAGNAPFRHKDLYVFCSKVDGDIAIMSAHGANAALVGQETQDWQDKAGKPFVKEMLEVSVEGEIHSVDYLWPRPGEEDPVQKSSYVTTIDDYLCGVGFYK